MICISFIYRAPNPAQQNEKSLRRDLPIKIVSGMLDNLALEIPQISKENARRKSNALSQAKKRENETDEQKQARREREAKAQALKRSALSSEERQQTKLLMPTVIISGAKRIEKL